MAENLSSGYLITYTLVVWCALVWVTVAVIILWVAKSIQCSKIVHSSVNLFEAICLDTASKWNKVIKKRMEDKLAFAFLFPFVIVIFIILPKIVYMYVVIVAESNAQIKLWNAVVLIILGWIKIQKGSDYVDLGWRRL